MFCQTCCHGCASFLYNKCVADLWQMLIFDLVLKSLRLQLIKWQSLLLGEVKVFGYQLLSAIWGCWFAKVCLAIINTLDCWLGRLLCQLLYYLPWWPHTSGNNCHSTLQDEISSFFFFFFCGVYKWRATFLHKGFKWFY